MNLHFRHEKSTRLGDTKFRDLSGKSRESSNMSNKINSS